MCRTSIFSVNEEDENKLRPRLLVPAEGELKLLTGFRVMKRTEKESMAAWRASPANERAGETSVRWTGVPSAAKTEQK